MTHATIMVENENGSLNGVDLRIDGTLQSAGRILYESYKSVSKSRELVSYGNIYALGIDLSPSRLTVEYGIDRWNSSDFKSLSFEEQNDLRQEDNLHTMFPYRDCINNDAMYLGHADNRYPAPTVLNFNQVIWNSDLNQIAHFPSIGDLKPDNVKRFCGENIFVMKKCRKHYKWYLAEEHGNKYNFVPLETALKN